LRTLDFCFKIFFRFFGGLWEFLPVSARFLELDCFHSKSFIPLRSLVESLEERRFMTALLNLPQLMHFWGCCVVEFLEGAKEGV